MSVFDAILSSISSGVPIRIGRLSSRFFMTERILIFWVTLATRTMATGLFGERCSKAPNVWREIIQSSVAYVRPKTKFRAEGKRRMRRDRSAEMQLQISENQLVGRCSFALSILNESEINRRHFKMKTYSLKVSWALLNLSVPPKP